MNIYKIYCVILFILYILYMDDNWVLRSANTSAGLSCVTYGNGKFVATGYYEFHPNNEPKIIYSFNGITWTTVNFMTGFHYSWNAVIYANGLFVAGGQGGPGGATDIFATSPNGINWTLRYADVGIEPSIKIINAITYANGLFVAVGTNIQTSPDGLNWTRRYCTTDPIYPLVSSTIVSIVYGNGLFIAITGGYRMYTSPDGINWTFIFIGYDRWNAIMYGNGLFVIVGEAKNVTSPDGINWTERNTYLNATTGKYVNNMFVALSSTDYHTSSDGLNWTTNNFSGSLIQSFWKSIEYANNIFVAVSNSGHPSVGYNRIITNGLTQVEPLISNFTILTKTFGESTFTIVAPNSDSDGSFTYTSSDSLVATISENIITIVGAGSTTITATQNETDNYTSGTITTTFIVNKASPSISNLSVPSKTFGESPFTIVAPNSDSDGSFTYTSSDSSVATISENIITIVGVGSATITATQEETDDFTSGIITTTLIINRETLTNPAIIENANELNYFLNTTSKYGNIINTFVINNNLSSSNSSMLFSTNYIEITRET